MAAKKRGLGRGLDALIGAGAETEIDEGELRSIAVTRIQPGPYQPRQHMDPERLQELADSIRAQGMIQPIVVREISSGKAGTFEIIAGERRWRAAQLAGFSDVPVLVKQVPDQAVVAMALIENIQREELTPLEEAQALKRLIDEFGLTHQQVAEAVGRSRASVSNLLRLMDLPAQIKTLLEQRKLDMGHARALLTLPAEQAISLARAAVEQEWSVRELEAAVRRGQEIPIAANSKPATPKSDPNILALERDLSEKLAARVSVQHTRNGRGKLVIYYHNSDELEGILERIR